jgi:hypothetical protein
MAQNGKPNYRRVTSDLLEVIKELNGCPTKDDVPHSNAGELAARLGASAMRSQPEEAADEADVATIEVPTVLIELGAYETKFWARDAEKQLILCDDSRVRMLISARAASIWKDASVRAHVEQAVEYARGETPGCNVVLLTQALAYDAETRSSMGKLIDEHGLSGVATAHPALFATPAADVTSYLVVDIGETSACVTAVHKGRVVMSTPTRAQCGGGTVTQNLYGRLITQGVSADQLGTTESARVETARRIKEAHVYVAEDADSELARAKDSAIYDQSYELPNGDVIVILGAARVLAFEDILTGHGGLLGTITDVLMSLPRDACDAVCSNVYLMGGPAITPGLRARIQIEVHGFNNRVTPRVYCKEYGRDMSASFDDIIREGSPFQAWPV